MALVLAVTTCWPRLPLPFVSATAAHGNEASPWERWDTVCTCVHVAPPVSVGARVLVLNQVFVLLCGRQVHRRPRVCWCVGTRVENPSVRRRSLVVIHNTISQPRPNDALHCALALAGLAPAGGTWGTRSISLSASECIGKGTSPPHRTRKIISALAHKRRPRLQRRGAEMRSEAAKGGHPCRTMAQRDTGASRNNARHARTRSGSGVLPA